MAAPAESFGREFSPSSANMWPLSFNLGQVNRHFVGRNKPFHELQNIYYDNSSKKLALISGPTGIGKTELATKFAQEMQKKGTIRICTLFNAETAESLNQCLTKLGNNIGTQTKNKIGENCKTSELFSNFINLYNNKISRSLLAIFDNVVDLYPDLLACLQLLQENDNTNAMTILTSTNSSLAKEDWKAISLEKWETSDAFEFIKKSLKNDFSEKEVFEKALCEKLLNHPLAIQQAVSYISQQQKTSNNGTSYSISDYLIELFETGQKNAGEMLDTNLNEISHIGIGKIILITLEITTAKIKKTQGRLGKLACSVLHKLAYLHPNGIQLEFLGNILKLIDIFKLIEHSKPKYTKVKQSLHKPHEKLNEAIKLLENYSLIKIENSVISIHRLLQEVIRSKLKSSINEETILLTSILKAIQNSPSFSRYDVSHLLNLWKYSSMDDNLIQQFPSMPLAIFNTLDDFGLLSEMYSFAFSNHKRLSEVLGESHVETLGMKYNLALALNKMGESEKSLEILREVWEKEKEILGEEHELTLTTAQNIGAIIKSLKSYHEATKVYGKVFESDKKTFGEYHPRTMTTRHNLALTLMEKGEVDLALEMFDEVLKWELIEFGERHQNTLETRHAIGTCLFDQGKYPEAQEIFESVWHLRKEELGEEHPDTLKSMHGLGVVYDELGNGEKALEIMKQVLVRRKKCLGTNHPQTINTQEWVYELRTGGI